MSDERDRDAYELAAGQAPAPESPDRGDDDAGRAALQQRLEHGQRREVVDPVAGGDMRRQAREHRRKPDQRFGQAEAESGGDAEHEAVDRLREIGAVGQEEGWNRFERLLDQRHDQAEDQHRADAHARGSKWIRRVEERVVDHPLEQRHHDADHDPAADGEPEHERGLVAVDLRLVQVDQIKDGDQERRDEDRGGDQPRRIEDGDAHEAGDEGPPELMDLVLAEVRKQRREHRGLRHVLARVGRVAMHTRLRLAGFQGLPLMGSATRAEHTIRGVLSAMVAPHGA